MIPKDCKRLAEVDFPIAEVSSAVLKREKKFPVPRGLPSTMHHWWARRPLGSSRAMLMGLLLPDPCDPQCPTEFKESARQILKEMQGRPKWWSEDMETDIGLRRVLLAFISDFASWENSSVPAYLDASRDLVKAVYGDESPLLVDPFSGGGAIPLEALRVGCDAFASDLNPVACLILASLLEEIPRYGDELVNELELQGKELRKEVSKELAEFYSKDQDGSIPVVYIWARTVRCEAPECGTEIPLLRSFWLCKKGKRKWALRPIQPSSVTDPQSWEFEVFQPRSDEEVRIGTVSKAKATCLCCGIVLSPERVRAQLSEQEGGADVIFDEGGNRVGGARLMAVVTLKQNAKGRYYRASSEDDYLAILRAQARISEITDDWKVDGKQGLCPVPNESLPPIGTLGFRVQRYGMLQWSHIFTARQKVAFVICGQKIASLYNADNQKSALAVLLAIALDKVMDFNCSLSQWRSTNEDVGHLFGRQALPIVWDFAETDPTREAYVGLERAINHVCSVVANVTSLIKNSGQVQQADATNVPLPDASASVWFTDPPYYDAIPYSDLSDFFLVWLKRTLPDHPLLKDPFDSENPLSPKNREIVQDETKERDGRVKDRDFFEDAMGEAFAEGRRVLREDGIGSVIFAHKTTEGWEALLSGMINGGWTITASWPIATEMGSRLRARDSAALATSVHLVCRPRPEDASVGDWADVLRELPKRVGDWMERLQGEGIRGADLVFACVGPALEIFSRCSKVETAEGREVKLPEYLEKVWEVVGRTALEQVLGTAGTQAQDGLRGGVLEEDSRLTALFLWTLQSTGDGDGENEEDVAKASAGGFSLPYDVVRRFAQPMGIDLDAWTGRIIEQKKGVVRLLPVTERSKALFGQEGASAAADWIETDPMAGLQQALFAEADGEGASASRARGRRLDPDAEIQTSNPTALDRLHAAMLLQASGHTNALRALIAAEQDRGPDFLRLANALTALYPRGSQEKRLLDAMLLAVPR